MNIMTQSMGDRKNQYIVFSSSQCKRRAESILLCLWNKGENSKIYRRDVDKAWESQGSCTDGIETSRIWATKGCGRDQKKQRCFEVEVIVELKYVRNIIGCVWEKFISGKALRGFLDFRTSTWRGGQGQRHPHGRSCFAKAGMVCQDIAEG